MTSRLGVYSHIYLDRVEKHVYRQLFDIPGFDVTVFYQEAQNGDRFPHPTLESVKPIQQPDFFKRSWQKYIARESPWMYRGTHAHFLDLIRRHRIELLHIYFGHYGIQLLPVFDALDIPVIVSFHGKDASAFLRETAYLSQIKIVFEKAALLFVRSESMGENLMSHGAPPEKIRVTRAGIDCSEFVFTPRTIPKELPVVFVQACRLIPKKGLETLLQAFSRCHRQYPQTRLKLIGEGPLEPLLREKAKTLGLSEVVQFTGYLETGALIQALNQSHIFVHPSESASDGDQEGIPNALLEAMALGLPVIATDHAGIPELIQHGQNGLLVPEKHPQALAQAMQTLLSHPGPWCELIDAARKTIETKHNLPAIRKQLAGFYQEALQIKRNRN